MKHYVGIDPGVNGGIAVINDRGIVQLIDMPEDEYDLSVSVWGVEMLSEVRVVLEWQSPGGIFGASKTSGLKLYANYMQLRMAMTTMGLPFDAVKPQIWQPALSIVKRDKKETTAAWKNRLCDRAKQLFPRVGFKKSLADALLLAYYCRILHNAKASTSSSQASE